MITLIAKFMGPTWGLPGSCRPQMGPMLAPWTIWERFYNSTVCHAYHYWYNPNILTILLTSSWCPISASIYILSRWDIRGWLSGPLYTRNTNRISHTDVKMAESILVFHYMNSTPIRKIINAPVLFTLKITPILWWCEYSDGISSE